MNRKNFLSKTLIAFVGIPFAANTKIGPVAKDSGFSPPCVIAEDPFEHPLFIFPYKAWYYKISQLNNVDTRDTVSLTFNPIGVREVTVSFTAQEFFEFREKVRRKAQGEVVDMREFEERFSSKPIKKT